MPISIEEISNHPVVVVLYPPGASGEFTAHALTQTIEQFYKTDMSWENETRCKFHDYFGRTLNCGSVVPEILLNRIDSYLKNITGTGQWHMGISHYGPERFDLLKTHGKKWPVIEITTLDSISKKFQHVARNEKINDLDIFKKYNTFQKNGITCLDQGFNPLIHLQVEWSELMLTDTENTYKKITKFLNVAGNVDQFVSMVHNYTNRNQNLIQLAKQST